MTMGRVVPPQTFYFERRLAMRVLKPQGIPVNFDGIERHFLFNINVIDEIQEHFDTDIISAINLIINDKDSELKKKAYDNLCYFVMVLANEDTRIYNKTAKEKRENIDIEYLKEVITHRTAQELLAAILKAFNGSMPQDDNDDPNSTRE